MLTDRIRDAIQERINRDPVIGETFSMTVSDPVPRFLVLSKLLRKAVDARQGGAFVFLPTRPSATKDFGLKILYPTGGSTLETTSSNSGMRSAM